MGIAPFGENLRAWRKTNRLKQAVLAEMLSVSQATISRWEAGTDIPPAHAKHRLNDLFIATYRGSLAYDAHMVSGQSQLRALFDLESITLQVASAGFQSVWPDFAMGAKPALRNHLVEESAALFGRDDFLQSVVAGDVAYVEAVSDRHVSLQIDAGFRHRWFAGFKRYGSRMLIDMTYEPCPTDTALGISKILYVDDLKSQFSFL
ncbi:MAG: hypothetical protein A3D16_19180 [Rhodobacterales bacterium RIFCSPHIGHO2_02_FULL_62_130]|jgi:transcriptional regulator with XRE-family HTH domain|nr:MAG: hypothetical protein A3D16_19180 [Rhodobacterales bacterium RIFCSPHIGHO2_02_FULL_62_130]OHC59952.1 MAG: hypothetical protein A3E48_08200 [Rhodobacterales bacterium RIFCSPHIGHO2_12_FULL_62_75]HCY99637.1 hypothetical protein [Rhodobacter sp.]